VSQEHKCIALACSIRLGRQEGLHEFGGIRDKVFKLAVDGVYGEDGVFANVGVTMLEAGTTDGDEGF
jgi:hypothetical protein